MCRFAGLWLHLQHERSQSVLLDSVLNKVMSVSIKLQESSWRSSERVGPRYRSKRVRIPVALYLHFRTNTPWEGYEAHIPHGLNSTTCSSTRIKSRRLDQLLASESDRGKMGYVDNIFQQWYYGHCCGKSRTPPMIQVLVHCWRKYICLLWWLCGKIVFRNWKCSL